MTNERARTLRRNQTNAERKLWRFLRQKEAMGFRFRRQHPIGDYIVDFICLEKKLIIELDGDQHSDAEAYDRRRDAWLQSRGYSVLRFWNREVYFEIDGVMTRIREGLSVPPDPHPKFASRFSTSPQGGG